MPDKPWHDGMVQLNLGLNALLQGGSQCAALSHDILYCSLNCGVGVRGTYG